MDKGFEAVPPIMAHQQFERRYLGEILMKQLYKALPWDKEFELPNGASATLKRFIGPRQEVVYPPAVPIASEKMPEPIRYLDWEFIFDFKLKNCDADHIEVMVKITGGGGTI